MSEHLIDIEICKTDLVYYFRLWNVETGANIASVNSRSSVRCCNFSFSGNLIAYSTDKAMGHDCELFTIDSRLVDSSMSNASAITTLPMKHSKITSMAWFLDDTIVTGHENGQVAAYDMRMGKEIVSVKDHTGQIQDLQMSRDGTMFITASKDTTAKLFDTETLDCLKTYKTERPVNSAAISPIFDHVVLGGGQEAMDVTTTSTRSGKFDSRFFHLVYEEEFARLKGHFGPINSLAFHPDGKSFASGGEDGFVRVNVFDPSYFDLVFE